MTIEQAELEIGECLTILVKRKFIKQEVEIIKIQFLDEQMIAIEDTSKQKSNAAKSRWNARAMQNDADAMHVHKSAMHNDADKIREDKKRENTLTHGKGKLTITIKKVFASDALHQIHNLKEYFEYSKQLSSLQESGWIHFEAFMKENSGKVFNEPDHLYNTFRNFCKEYKPPPKSANKYESAEYNKTLWTLEAWEQHYKWKLDSDQDFRQHFGYNGKLSAS
jgi:hypothetical protein